MILNEKERDQEATQSVVSLLDDIESYKSQVNDEGTKLLLHDNEKALAFVLNLAMSIYNGILVQIQDERIDNEVGKGLWCCIELFQCCKHLWADKMDAAVKEQCDKRIKYSKYYLRKLKRGELQNQKEAEPGTPEPLLPTQAAESQSSEVEDEIPTFVEENEDPKISEHLKESKTEFEGELSPSLSSSGSVEDSNHEGASPLIAESPELPERLPSPVPVKQVLPKPVVKHDVATLKEIMSREDRIQKAQRSAKYAISALNYDDVVTAKAELLQALRLVEALESE